MRTVADTAVVMELLVNKSLAPFGSQNYTAALNISALRNARVGFLSPLLSNITTPVVLRPDIEVVAAVNRVIDVARAGGATVVNNSREAMMLLERFQTITTDSAPNDAVCVPVDFRWSMNDYFSSLPPTAPIKSLSELLATGEYLPSVSSLLRSAVNSTGAPSNTPACHRLTQAQAQVAALFTGFMDQHNLDVLLFPSENQPPPVLPAVPPPTGWFGTQLLSAFSGLPVLVLPAGCTEDTHTPIGVSLLGRAYSEARLLALGYAIEQRLNGRVPPPMQQNT